MLHSLADNWSNYEVIKLKKRIDNVKVVSFDVFDTLVKRDIKSPTDLFKIVEAKTGCEGFAEKRIDAEAKARISTEKEEITLEDIYSFLDISFDMNKLKTCEIDCEISISSINRDIIEFYDYCVSNKIVVLTSDMYLPQWVIEKILKKNKIDGFKKIYLSNDYGKTKLNGKLFEKVLDELNVEPSEILHIGNSFKADYLSPKRLGIKSVKCATYKNRLQRKYDNYLDAEKFSYELLQSFLNNNTPAFCADEYFTFGYEVFGPLLYGFIRWLHEETEKDNIEQIFFLARDGYVMKKMYDQLGYSIPTFYFEASRRSLRVPRYSNLYSYEDIIDTLTVPNMTNVVQIVDSFGLDYSEYSKIITECGIDIEEQVKRDTLKENERFKALFNKIEQNISDNAAKEKEMLMKYLLKYDFSKKTAIVDIGWGGSMQKYLTESLNEFGIECDLIGYYVGLTLKAKENLGNSPLKAKGFAFDCLNNKELELESSYIGLIESMFLEQAGSVKCYVEQGENIAAKRYEYEYFEDGVLAKEAVQISKVQDGALKFAYDYSNTLNSELIECNPKVLYGNIHGVGAYPKNINIRQFGEFRFFNCGNQVYLARPRGLFSYLSHLALLKRDIYDSQWKTGFLKALLKLDLPYMKIFDFLRRLAN